MLGFRSRRRLISPLTWRILAVNVTALIILAAGVLYLADYRRDLIDAELSVLRARAESLAAALAETAVRTGDGDRPSIMLGAARATVRLHAEATDQQARLFDADGAPLVDSRKLTGPGGSVTIDDLPPPRPAAADRIGDLLGWLDRIFAPLLDGGGDAETAKTDEIAAALGGQTGTWIDSDSNGVPVLSVAMPVAHFDRVAGVVVLSRTAHEIDAAVLEARVTVLRLAGITLVVTVLVSLYLSRTIVRPLLQLAAAAERIRRDGTPSAKLPDLVGRRDEIGDLATVLREMMAALGRRMDTMERFAGDVSHEIKNPLGSIRSAVDTASRVDDPDQLRTLLAIIEDDVRRLDRLITDIADASRLDVELARTRAEPVDMAGLLSALVEISGPSAAERGVTLRLSIPPGQTLVVAGLESRLMQVFDNLVSNAVSFSPAAGRVILSAAAADGQVQIKVEDDGPGIPEDACERIFERFYSQRPDGQPRGSHSGLGLSIVRQIVEAFGGTIDAENRHDPAGRIEGARFVVCLPAHPVVDRSRPGSKASPP